MHHFLNFVVEHWLLVVAFLVVLMVLLYEEFRLAQAGGARLAPQAVIHLMNRERGVVLDIRNKEQFQAGHIIDALNVSDESLETGLKKLAQYKDKPVIVVCAVGQKSQAMAAKLRVQGFSKVNVLSGGVKAWKEADYPLIKGK